MLLLRDSIILLAVWALSISALQAQTQAVAPTSAADTLALSLAQAQEYALQNNINGQINRLNIDYARQQVREVKAFALPQANASIRYAFNLKLPAQLVPADAFGFPAQMPVTFNGTPGLLEFPQDTTNSGGFTKLTFGTRNNIALGVEASQLLFDGSYTLGLRATELFVERASLQTKQTEYELKTNITSAYFGALVLQDNIAVLKKNIGIVEKTLYETSALNKAGFVEEIDVDRLRLTLANLSTQVASLQRTAETAQAALKYQMGMGLEQPIRLTDRLEEFVAQAEREVVVSFGDLQNEAYRNRMELQLLDMQNTFRELDIKQIKAKYLPSVAAFWQGNLNFQSDGLNIFKGQSWIPSSLIGVQANIPIFDGFQKKAQIAQRVIQQKQAFKQEEFAKKSIDMQLEQGRLQYISAFEALKSQRSSLQLAQKIYDVSLTKYKAGVGSSLEVTSAEGKLFETQGLYIQALYNLVNAKASLDKSLGR